MCRVELGNVSYDMNEVGSIATLKTRLDHVQRMDSQRGNGAGREACNCLDQRGGEARMVVVHQCALELIIVEMRLKRKKWR